LYEKGTLAMRAAHRRERGDMSIAATTPATEFRPPFPRPRGQQQNLLSLLRALYRNPLEAWTREHFEKPMVTTNVAGRRIVLVNDPAGIRHVLLDNAGNYRKDRLQQRVLSAGLRNGLLTAEGEQWRVQRRTLAPIFAPKHSVGFSTGMLGAAKALVESLRGRDGEIVDVAAEMSSVTLDVLERTIFSDGLGRNREEFRVAMSTYFMTIGQIDALDVLGVPDFVPRLGRWRARPVLRFFDQAVDEIITKRRERLAKDPADAPRDVLTLLLEALDPETRDRMSETEVRANVLTFIAAGHETTALALSWSLYLLSQSPHWCERIIREAEREKDCPVVEMADRLVETRSVVEEALRLYPPIAALTRVALDPDVVAGQPIRRGTMIVIAPYVLHRHRMLWTRPDNFDPARFLGADRSKIDRFAFLPFSAGPRSCIGISFALQEATLVLSTLLQNFTFELAPGHRVWPLLKVTVRPEGGMPMLIRRRQ
jgi:cytochrome P450